MENTFSLNRATSFGSVSCNLKSKGSSIGKASKTDEPEKLYACPIHPEIKGKLNDKCVQCGMALTVPVP